MPGVARIMDRTYGVCYAHKRPITVGGTIITGDPQTNADGLPVSRLGDTVLADCGHTSKIVTGSVPTFSSGIFVARLGDSVADGPYIATIITASTDVFEDG